MKLSVKFILRSRSIRLFTASLVTHAEKNAREASAKHAGVGGGVGREAIPTSYPAKSSILRWRPVLSLHAFKQSTEIVGRDPYSTVQCSAVQCSAVQCSAVQCNAMQYNTIQ